MRYKHKWEIARQELISLYDTQYVCTTCKAWHTVSIDSIESNLPEYGCHYPTQSELQRRSGFTTWVEYFFLKEFPLHFATRLNTSMFTNDAIIAYNQAVQNLKRQIDYDYKIYRQSVLNERKKAKKESLAKKK